MFQHIVAQWQDENQVQAFNNLKPLKLKHNPKLIHRKIVTESDVIKLMNTKVVEEKLEMSKNMWLFQLYANGLRVSDLLLMKWDDFQLNGGSSRHCRFTYTMYKTENVVEMPLNVNMCIILSKLIGKEHLYDLHVLNCKHEFIEASFGISDDKKVKKITVNQLKNEILPKYTLDIENSEYEQDEYQNVYNKFNNLIDEYNGYYFYQKDAKLVMRLIDFMNACILAEQTSFIWCTTKAIQRYKDDNKCGNKFVWPYYLKDEHFEDVNNKHQLTYLQGKKLASGEIMYARDFQKAKLECGVKIPATPHSSRHTFAQLQIEAGVDTRDVSGMLAHSKISITEIYLQHGFNKNRLDNHNINLANRLRMVV